METKALETPAAGALERLRAFKPWQWAVALSFVASCAVPLFSRSPYADLSRWYTDHLHHAFATWVFLQDGLQIYTRPFQELWSNTGYPHPLFTWGHMPGMVYPPGVFAVFLPLTLIGRYLELSTREFAGIGVFYMVALAHWALYETYKTLWSLQRGNRLLVAGVAWLIIVPLGVQGFYDPLYLACGAVMLRRIVERRFESALVWFSLAMFSHFRAAVFTPFAVMALWQLLRGRAVREWPWRTLALLGVMSVVFLGTFALAYPTTATLRMTHPSVLLSEPGKLAVFLIVTAAATAALSRWADGVTVATVALVTLLAMVEVQDYWWHNAMILAVLLGIGVWRKSEQPVPARTVAVGWAAVIAPLVWRAPLIHVFPALVQHLQRW